MSTSEQTRPADHPLDPLTADEFRQAAAILRRDRGVGARWRFASIELHEPSKDVLRAAQPGAPLAREASPVKQSPCAGTGTPARPTARWCR